ncbi:hypothetical protein LINGRAPRIM_LOCUS323 [Linum grandiflorum]
MLVRRLLHRLQNGYSCCGIHLSGDPSIRCPSCQARRKFSMASRSSV